MDREDFLFALREQYAEEIHEAYMQCAHENGKVVDFSKLNQILTKMMKTAKVDGLPHDEFSELVRTTLPAVADKVHLTAPGKKAA